MDQAQIDRITEITNARGSVFGFPQSGGPLIPEPYTFFSTQVAQSNHLQITVMRDSTGTLITEAKTFHPPLPEPPSPGLDSLVNSILDLVERQIELKPVA